MSDTLPLSISMPHLVCFVRACSSKSWSVLYSGHFGKKWTNKKPVLILPPLRQENVTSGYLFFLLLKECVCWQQVLGCSVRALSSLTGGWAQTPCSGSMESQPLDRSGSPSAFLHRVHLPPLMFFHFGHSLLNWYCLFYKHHTHTHLCHVSILPKYSH